MAKYNMGCESLLWLYCLSRAAEPVPRDWGGLLIHQTLHVLLSHRCRVVNAEALFLTLPQGTNVLSSRAA